MECSWLHKEGCDCLIVFCNGWGMDSLPFKPLAAQEVDVLNLYDFRNLEPKDIVPDVLSDYKECILISWSMGVWAGQKIFAQYQHLFSRTIAINGTLCPIHDRFGIPRELFAGTADGWSDISRRKFYHRVCGSMNTERCFLKNQPERHLKDQQDELIWYLGTVDCHEDDDSIYNEVLVSDKDRIVPTSNQMAFWGKERVLQLEGSHFPFYRWNSWDELLNSIHRSSI